MVIDQRHPVKRIRLAARIIGSIISVFLLAAVVGDSIALALNGGFHIDSEGVLFVFVPVLAVWTAFILSWWWEKLEGWLLIASYLLLCLAPSFRAIYVGNWFIFFLDMWLYALPLLLAGILFLISSSRLRRAAH